MVPEAARSALKMGSVVLSGPDLMDEEEAMAVRMDAPRGDRSEMVEMDSAQVARTMVHLLRGHLRKGNRPDATLEPAPIPSVGTRLCVASH